MKQEDPTPDYILETLNAYQRTEALHAAIEIDLFRAIGRGHRTPRELAGPCEASERGLRMLCDYLVVRRLRLDIDDLYDSGGQYSYQSGFNRAALWAFGLGVSVALAGKLDSRLDFLFSGAWFSAAAVSFVTYWILMRSSRARQGEI